MKSKSYLCKMDSGTCIQNTQLNLLQLKIIKLEHMHIPHTQTHMCRHMYTQTHLPMCAKSGKINFFFCLWLYSPRFVLGLGLFTIPPNNLFVCFFLEKIVYSKSEFVRPKFLTLLTDNSNEIKMMTFIFYWFKILVK